MHRHLKSKSSISYWWRKGRDEGIQDTPRKKRRNGQGWAESTTAVCTLNREGGEISEWVQWIRDKHWTQEKEEQPRDVINSASEAVHEKLRASNKNRARCRVGYHDGREASGTQWERSLDKKITMTVTPHGHHNKKTCPWWNWAIQSQTISLRKWTTLQR